MWRGLPPVKVNELSNLSHFWNGFCLFHWFYQKSGANRAQEGGGGTSYPQFTFVPLIFCYSPMWRAGPHCLAGIAAPNDSSAVCSHELCPLLAALICNHLPSDSAKVSTHCTQWHSFQQKKPKPTPILSVSSLPCSPGATHLGSPLQLYPKKSLELVTQRHACRLCGEGKGKTCYSFESPEKLTFISQQIFLPCKQCYNADHKS